MQFSKECMEQLVNNADNVTAVINDAAGASIDIVCTCSSFAKCEEKIDELKKILKDCIINSKNLEPTYQISICKNVQEKDFKLNIAYLMTKKRNGLL